MVKRDINYDIYASYVLIDTWFASPTMFMKMKKISVDVVYMLKKTTNNNMCTEI